MKIFIHFFFWRLGSSHCSFLCVVRRGTAFIFLSHCTTQKAAMNMNCCENLTVMARLWFTSCQIISQSIFFTNGLSIKNWVHWKHLYTSAIQSTFVCSTWTSENGLRCSVGLATEIYIYLWFDVIYSFYISPKVTDLFLEWLCCHWHKLYMSSSLMSIDRHPATI